MDVTHYQKIIDLDNLANWLNIQTAEGKLAFKEKCGIWQSKYENLQSLSYQFASVQSAIQRSQDNKNDLVKSVQDIYRELSQIEPDLKNILESSSDLERESTSELIFFNSILKPLNFIPFILTLWSFIRVYLLPGMAVLMPIFMCILPYILLHFIFKINMPLDRYFGMLVGLLTGDLASSIQSPDAIPPLSKIVESFMNMFMESPAQAIMKVGGIGMTLVQTFAQPYLTFKHLYSINKIIITKTDSLLKLKELYSNLESILKENGMELQKLPFPDTQNDRQLLAHALLDSSPFRIALKNMGKYEALFQLAANYDICPVNWINEDISDNKPFFEIRNTFDINVSKDSRKPISVLFSNESKQHALLTGPNRGGKSTALRSLVMSALLAHTYGCVLGSYAKMTPFKYMYASLKADDIPGSKSHFEREVEFTSKTLYMDGSVLVFIDELFHTTNPPDAYESCRLYCNRLWNRSDIVSVISTHIFELVENSDKDKVQRLCCPAEKDKNGEVLYKYGIESGICKVSSVYEILRKYGYEIMCA